MFWSIWALVARIFIYIWCTEMQFKWIQHVTLTKSHKRPIDWMSSKQVERLHKIQWGNRIRSNMYVSLSFCYGKFPLTILRANSFLNIYRKCILMARSISSMSVWTRVRCTLCIYNQSVCLFSSASCTFPLCVGYIL